VQQSDARQLQREDEELGANIHQHQRRAAMSLAG
jgi:hypothetical protein